MTSSAYYFSDSRLSADDKQPLVFVLGSHEHIQAETLIRQAVEKGASVIVMAREYAGVYRQLFQNDLHMGITYVFSRSVKETLRRLQAKIDQ